MRVREYLKTLNRLRSSQLLQKFDCWLDAQTDAYKLSQMYKGWMGLDDDKFNVMFQDGSGLY